MIVDKTELAKILGTNAAVIDQRVVLGMPCKLIEDKPGHKLQKFCTKDVIDWMIDRHVEQVLCDFDNGMTESEKLQRTRRLEIDLKMQERKGGLVPIHYFRDYLNTAVEIFTEKLACIPGRLCGELAMKDNPAEIRQIISDETTDIQRDTKHAILSGLQRVLNVYYRHHCPRDSAATNGHSEPNAGEVGGGFPSDADWQPRTRQDPVEPEPVPNSHRQLLLLPDGEASDLYNGRSDG